MSNSLSSSSIRDFKANKAKHSEQLLELTSTKFDLGNKNHINALNEYINSFECTANQHYLFQSLCAGFKDWKLIWLLGYFVPTSITLYYFTANVAGYFLDRFSLDRFHNQLAK